MCLYITLALPAGADVALLDGVAARYQRRLLPARNASVQRHLPPGDHYCLTTLGHCDCDTALASGRSDGPGGDAGRDDRARRLRRRGWSEAKIARALEQANERTQAVAASRIAAAQEELHRWQDFLAALLEHGLPSVRLLVHMYSGPLDEEIALGEPLSHRLRDLAPARLATMERDVLHEIQR